MLYSLARSFLFGMDPEAAHDLALGSLKLIERAGMASMLADAGPARSVKLMGLEFPNALGLAAGLDKNGEYIDALAAMGFGFLEIGTVTPRPQPGNPKPRMFRLPKAQALINRLGFNNHGVEQLLANVARARYRGVLAGKLKTEQSRLADAHGRYVPLVLKIAPDLDEAQLGSIARCLLKHKLDGVIAPNTTVSRSPGKGLRHAEE